MPENMKFLTQLEKANWSWFVHLQTWRVWANSSPHIRIVLLQPSTDKDFVLNLNKNLHRYIIVKVFPLSKGDLLRFEEEQTMKSTESTQWQHSKRSSHNILHQQNFLRTEVSHDWCLLQRTPIATMNSILGEGYQTQLQ